MIYIKTELGRQALKERSESMPRKYHFPFMMCDGQRDHADILIAEARTGFGLEDLEQMLVLGFIAPLPVKTVPVKADPINTATLDVKAMPTQQQANVFLDASKMATALSANLGLRGFRLNLAVQTASNLTDLDALLPQLEKVLGVETVKPLADLLKTASR
jgi:hypothetical protein